MVGVWSVATCRMGLDCFHGEVACESFHVDVGFDGII